MAFFSLPIELCELIFDLLDRESLSRFSRTTKTLRSIAEPVLYRRLSFENHNARQIRLVLLLLIVRPELAQHIQSVSLVSKNTQTVTPNIPAESWAELRGCLEDIRVAIDYTLAFSSGSAERSMQWLSSLLSGNQQH
jgi:hypothetical protein